MSKYKVKTFGQSLLFNYFTTRSAQNEVETLWDFAIFF